MEELFCPICQKLIKPVVNSKKFLFFGKESLSCPHCGCQDLLQKKPEMAHSANGSKTSVIDNNPIPTLEYFLECYNKGEFYQALGIEQGSSKEIIHKAIDKFQEEYFYFQSEWSIPLANITEHILKPKKQITSSRLLKLDKNSWKPAIPFFEEAEQLENDGKYQEAIERCSRAVEIAPSFFYAYQKRAWISLLSPDYQDLLDQIIEDCSVALLYDPDSAHTFNDRGRAYARKNDFELASQDYQKAYELDPTYAIAALNAMEADICLGKYRLAEGLFGCCRGDVVEQHYIVIAHSLVCIAKALNGRNYLELLPPLENRIIRVKNLIDWCTDEIDHHLSDLQMNGYHPDRVAHALEIQSLFKNHFD